MCVSVCSLCALLSLNIDTYSINTECAFLIEKKKLSVGSSSFTVTPIFVGTLTTLRRVFTTVNIFKMVTVDGFLNPGWKVKLF